MLIIDEGSVGPELAGDFVACQQITRPLQEHQQDLKGLRVQLDANSLPAQLSRCSINLKYSEAIAPLASSGSFVISDVSVSDRGSNSGLFG